MQRALDLQRMKFFDAMEEYGLSGEKDTVKNGMTVLNLEITVIFIIHGL